MPLKPPYMREMYLGEDVGGKVCCSNLRSPDGAERAERNPGSSLKIRILPRNGRLQRARLEEVLPLQTVVR